MINEKDAPEGYKAVECVDDTPCIPCALDNSEKCWGAPCMPDDRQDGESVIFIKDDSAEINLPAADESFKPVATHISNNKVNLCDSCTKHYPACDGKGQLFGDGKGNDNVVCCSSYTPGFVKVKT